ncbi:MAG: hypothetical protein ACQESJ_04330, partial [Bacteroidota bacterium]
LYKTAEIIQPDYLFTAITTSITGMDLSTYFQKLSDTFHQQKIFVTGLQVRQKGDVDLPANIEVVASPLKFSKKLQDL